MPPTSPQEVMSNFNILMSESDRGCLLAAAAMLEESLGSLFGVCFIDEVVSRSLLESGSSSPLGTFSARSKLAYSLGLISKPMFNDLELVRQMRNDAAHFEKKRGDGFLTGFQNITTKQRARSFQTLPPWLTASDLPPRLIFSFGVSLITATIEAKAGVAKVVTEADRRLALKAFVGMAIHDSARKWDDLCASFLKSVGREDLIPSGQKVWTPNEAKQSAADIQPDQENKF